MAETCKIVDQFRIGEYLVIKLESSPVNDFRAFLIDGKRYKAEIAYDMPNCYGIEYSGEITGDTIECVG